MEKAGPAVESRPGEIGVFDSFLGEAKMAWTVDSLVRNPRKQ